MSARGITVLGSTGSVGQSTLDLLQRAPDDWRVDALTANRDAAGLAAQARAVGARIAVVTAAMPVAVARAASAPSSSIMRCSNIDTVGLENRE